MSAYRKANSSLCHSNALLQHSHHVLARGCVEERLVASSARRVADAFHFRLVELLKLSVGGSLDGRQLVLFLRCTQSSCIWLMPPSPTDNGANLLVSVVLVCPLLRQLSVQFFTQHALLLSDHFGALLVRLHGDLAGTPKRRGWRLHVRREFLFQIGDQSIALSCQLAALGAAAAAAAAVLAERRGIDDGLDDHLMQTYGRMPHGAQCDSYEARIEPQRRTLLQRLPPCPSDC